MEFAETLFLDGKARRKWHGCRIFSVLVCCDNFSKSLTGSLSFSVKEVLTMLPHDIKRLLCSCFRDILYEISARRCLSMLREMGGIMRNTLTDELLTVFLEGRVDSTNAKQFEYNLLGLARKYPERGIKLDATELEYISSVGLRSLLKLRKSTK